MPNLPAPPDAPPSSPPSRPALQASSTPPADAQDDSIVKPSRALPKEVWSHIAGYVREPLPERKAIKERCQIRQVDLARMMSVSKLVNNATAPVLYRHVIADDLYGLFCGFTTGLPAAPGISTKAELLKSTRTLYLEYPTRPMTDTHDLYLMTPAFHRPGLQARPATSIFSGHSYYRPDASLASLVEAEWLFLKYPETQFQHSMPDLRVMCCGALFGTDETGWEMCKRSSSIPDFAKRLQAVQKVFAQMYLSGNVIDYCQSSIYSAYCIDTPELQAFPPPAQSRIMDRDPSAHRTLTVHLNLGDFSRNNDGSMFDMLPCYPNVHTRWCFDQPLPGYDANGSPFPRAILSSVREALAGRHQRRSESSEPHAYRILGIRVDAHIPITQHAVDRIVTRATGSRFSGRRREIHRMNKAAWKLGYKAWYELFIENPEGKIDGHEDDLDFSPIELDCPPCPACQWEPGMREGNDGLKIASTRRAPAA